MSDAQEKKENEKYCSSCGAIIKKEAIICPKCGVQQKDTVNSEIEEVTVKDAKKSSTGMIIVFILLIIVALIMGGYFGFEKGYQIGYKVGFLEGKTTILPEGLFDEGGLDMIFGKILEFLGKTL
ncbi:MAG: zinc ribbon domain-containing protein [Treponema sp.]|nr:zinc ribbon domain-containing protein [Treponema sp.]